MVVTSRDPPPSEATDQDAAGESCNGCCSCCSAVSRKCRRRVGELNEFAGELSQLCSQLNVRQRARKLLTVDELKNRLPVLKWIPKYRYDQLRCSLFTVLTQVR